MNIIIVPRTAPRPSSHRAPPMRVRPLPSLSVASLALLTSVSGRAAAAEEPPRWLKCARHVGRCEFAEAHEALEELGVVFAFSVTTVWQANHKGGIRSSPHGKGTGSWDIGLELDTARLGLWDGGKFCLHLEGSSGQGVDPRYVGSLFGVNTDADTTAGRRLQCSELWYEHDLADGLLALRIGKMDATTDFDTNAFANDECHQFLNAALVNNPTIPFPDYALGAQAIVRPGAGLSFAVGAWDANAEGAKWGRQTLFGGRAEWFLAAEASLETKLWRPGGGELPGAVRLGVWHTTQRFERLDTGETERGASGLCASLDQVVYKEKAEAGDSQGLGLFFRYGYAPQRFSELQHFGSFGAQYQGLLPGRDDDVLGIGLACGRLGGPSRQGARYDGEGVAECYYRIALAKRASVTLDAQYVRHPGAGPSSFVPGLRVHVQF